MDEIRFELDCDASIPHFHDELEILFVLSGRLNVMINGTNFVMKEEDIIVFDIFEYHEIYRETGGHTISAFIHQSLVHQAKIGRIKCCSCIQPGREEYFRLLKARLAIMYKEFLEHAEAGKLTILSELYAVLSVLRQHFSEESIPEWKEREETEHMREILLYVGSHYQENLSLQAVAERFYLSSSYLSREFKRLMHISFSEYVRKLRLNKAAYMLSTAKESITETAMSCGFSNVNTFIINFRQQFGKTPNEYRKSEEKEEKAEEPRERPLSIMSLTKYIFCAENLSILMKGSREPVRLKIDIRKDCGKTRLYHNVAVSVGWAKDLMFENVREAVRRAKREIGFQYVYFHGLLDDSMDVYHENPDGEPYLSFIYVDMVIDFLISVDIRPCIEFSFTPAKLAERQLQMFGLFSCLCLPTDLMKWAFIVESMLRHFTKRYGVEKVRTWNFLPSPAVYMHYGVFSLEDYLAYYTCTFRAIRKVLPEAFIIGCTMDTGLIAKVGKEDLVMWLLHCKRQECLPDAFGFQCFHADFQNSDMKDVERSITARVDEQAREPVPPSRDADILFKEVHMIKEVLEEHGLSDRPLFLTAWNSTIWQSDLGNDTCYKAAFIVKNILENTEDISGFAFCHLTDNTERTITGQNTYYGGYGLMTYQGIPKAPYFAYRLLGELEDFVADRGPGYIVTCTKERKKVRILLYNYSHYSKERHISYVLSDEEQRTYDRYYGFEEKGMFDVHFYLEGLENGTYEKESLIVNRDYGSSYDIWSGMGAPAVITEKQRRYIEKKTEPKYEYELLQVGDTNTLLISVILDIHEIRLISINKR